MRCLALQVLYSYIYRPRGSLQYNRPHYTHPTFPTLTHVRSLCVTRTNGSRTPFGLVAAAQLFSWRASPPGFESSTSTGPSSQGHTKGTFAPLNLTLHQDEWGFSGLHCALLQSWPTVQPRCSPLAYPLVRIVSVLLRSHALFAISVSATPFVSVPISSHLCTLTVDVPESTALSEISELL